MKHKFFSIMIGFFLIANMFNFDFAYAVEQQPVPTPEITVDQLGVTDKTVGTIVRWTIPDDAPPEFYGFILEKKIPNGDRIEIVNYYPDDLNDFGYYMDDYVDLGKTYTYYIRAYVRSSNNPDERYHRSDWAEKTITLEPIKFANVVVTTTNTEAKITWASDYELDCKIEYGLSTEYGTSKEENQVDDSNHIDHTAALSNLTPDTTYHYKIVGNEIDDESSIIESADFSFKTKGGSVDILNHTGSWVGNYKAEVSFASNKTVTAEVMIEKDGDIESRQTHNFSAGTTFSHQFDVYDQTEYNYYVSISEEGEDPSIDGAQGKFTTPPVVISDARIIQDGQNYNVLWNTDIPARSKIVYKCSFEELKMGEKIDDNFSLNHSITINKSDLEIFETGGIYYVTVYAYGNSNNEKVAYAGEIYFIPLEISLASATPILVNTATLEYDVVFTWRTSLSATGTVLFSGTTPGTVSCLNSDTVCSATARNLKRGAYQFTITATSENNETETYEAEFQIGDDQKYVIVTFISDDGNNTNFYWHTYPENLIIDSATLRGRAETEATNPSTGNLQQYTACPISTVFSGDGHGTLSVGSLCAGQYRFWGEAKTDATTIPISFAGEEATCYSSGGYGGSCPNQFGKTFSFGVAEKSYSSPVFSGYEHKFSRSLAFPWQWSESWESMISVFRYSSINNYSYAILRPAISIFSATVPVGSPPTDTVIFDQLYNQIQYDDTIPSYSRMLHSGETVYGPPYPNCPGSVQSVYSWPSGSQNLCSFTWP